MLTDAKLRSLQSKHKRDQANECHGICLALCVTMTPRRINNPAPNHVIHCKRKTVSPGHMHSRVRKIARQTALLDALTHEYIRYPERRHYPALLNQTPHKNQGYTPSHPPAN
jgi:hypothetical protein